MARTIPFLNQNMTKKIKEYYKKMDEHLFSASLEELLTTRLSEKLRFLERSNYLFKESRANNDQCTLITTQKSRTPQQRQHKKWGRQARKKLTQSTLLIQFWSWHDEQCNYGEILRKQRCQVNFNPTSTRGSEDHHKNLLPHLIWAAHGAQIPQLQK